MFNRKPGESNPQFYERVETFGRVLALVLIIIILYSIAGHTEAPK